MTNTVTPKLRELAERLLAHEAASAASAERPGSKSGSKSGPTAFRVCEKLRSPLTMLAGATGFQSLLLRALTLAQREAPGLAGVQVNLDGLLDCGALEGELDHEAEMFLVAHLIGLLVAFIGESLTLRLMQDAWPESAFSPGDSERASGALPGSPAGNGETQAQPGSAETQKARKPSEKDASGTAERTGEHESQG